MATNSTRWVKNLLDEDAGGPLIVPGKFQAGSTQAIKRGELIKLSGGNWVPLATDTAMTAIVAVSHCEIKAGDFAGYYPIEVPRPGDIWEFPYDTATNPALGDALYNATSSQTVTATVGTNILGYVAGWPQLAGIFPQGHASDDASMDKGTTIATIAKVHMAIKQAASYFAAMCP